MMLFLCDFHLQSKIGVMFDFFVRSSIENKRIFLSFSEWSKMFMSLDLLIFM